MNISVLCDNQPLSKRFACEHGLSIFVEVNGNRFLFDTGQGDCFLKNALTMGIDLAGIDYVVLSHGHYDHAGGLKQLMAQFPHIKIVMHPQALKQRFSISSVMTKENGFPHNSFVGQWENQIIKVDRLFELLPGVTLFPLPFAAPANPRLVEPGIQGQLVPDTFMDELFIMLKEGEHQVLLSGCTHHGIVHVLDYCRTQLSFGHFDLVLGGLHLSGSDELAILQQIELCRAYDVSRWALNHCTGERAFDLWQAAYQGHVMTAKAGEVISL
ncbi:MAG: MBL fold metallo-hydrolase [Breznakibacter sp.]